MTPEVTDGQASETDMPDREPRDEDISSDRVLVVE